MGKQIKENKNEVDIVKNKKAWHDYEILETLEAGIVLTGSEVKSLREGQATLAGAFVHFHKGELWLEGLDIAAYSHSSSHSEHFAKRRRKLLMHKGQIEKWAKSVETKGTSMIALKLYFTRGIVKVEVGLGRGKKKHDKRQDIKKRESDRNLGRMNKRKR